MFMLPGCVKQGEPVRLTPVMFDSDKEQDATSILLTGVGIVHEFQKITLNMGKKHPRTLNLERGVVSTRGSRKYIRTFLI